MPTTGAFLLPVVEPYDRRSTSLETLMKKFVALCTCSALLLALSCKDKDDSPDLPPATSLSTDFSALTAAPVAAKNAPTGATAVPEDYLNFANAFVRVKVVQFFAGLVIVLPAAAMGLALNEDPDKQGNTWFWSVTVGEATADLEVSVSLVSGFDVELYVTNAELERFLWVEGNFGDGSGTGEWVLHDPEIAGADKRALSIQWTYVSDTDRALTYEILSPTANDDGDVFQGDTFAYTVDGMTATLEYVDADVPTSTALIEWDTTTGAGSITVPEFNGGATACWDELFENAACP